MVDRPSEISTDHSRFATTRRSILTSFSGVGIGTLGLTGDAGARRFGSEPPRSVDNEREKLILRLEEGSRSSGIETAERRKTRRLTEQSDVVSRLEDRGATVEHRFWLTNAVLVTDAAEIDLTEIDGISSVHPNFRVQRPDPDSRHETVRLADHDATTYGVKQVDAPRVWDTFGTRGEGVRVVVLDTGVDAHHPDVTLAEGGWAEFDENGDRIHSDPFDPDGHGTHVSGTVAGGSESGVAIGVAPESELYHGKVFDGNGTFAQLLAGMEWAVETNADIVNMSLGADTYEPAFIDPIRSARELGTLFVTSVGNHGEGTSLSPGNVYDNVAVGATDASGDIARFSSGEQIHTPTTWGVNAPDDWPEWYTVPDIAAPGVDVLSAYPTDVYAKLNGTSMAAPHVTGVAALIASVHDLTAVELESLLSEQTIHPEGGERDTRWGTGIVNAYRGMTAAQHDGVLVGTVTGESGATITGIDVETDHGTRDVTRTDGLYSIPVPEGAVEVNTRRFGYGASATVDVTGETSQDLQLEPRFEVRIADQPPDASAGGRFSMEIMVAHLERYMLEIGAASENISASNVSAMVDDEPIKFGESTTFSSVQERTLELVVEISSATADGSTLELVHTFEGLDETIIKRTGPTEVSSDAEPGVLEILDPGFGELVGADRTLTTRPVVSNTGDLTIDRSVDFTVSFAGEDRTYEEDITVQPGESETVEFAITFVDGLTAGTGEQTIDTGDDTAVGTFEYLASDIRIESIDAPESVGTGTPFDIDVVVSNDGDIEGEATLRLAFDGEIVDTGLVSVDTGETEIHTLSVGTENLLAGPYEYAVDGVGAEGVFEGIVEVVDEKTLATYAGDDGVVRLRGVLNAISDYSNGAIGLRLVLDAIGAYSTGQPIE